MNGAGKLSRMRAKDKQAKHEANPATMDENIHTTKTIDVRGLSIACLPKTKEGLLSL